MHVSIRPGVGCICNCAGAKLAPTGCVIMKIQLYMTYALWGYSYTCSMYCGGYSYTCRMYCGIQLYMSYVLWDTVKNVDVLWDTVTHGYTFIMYCGDTVIDVVCIVGYSYTCSMYCRVYSYTFIMY